MFKWGSKHREIIPVNFDCLGFGGTWKKVRRKVVIFVAILDWYTKFVFLNFRSFWVEILFGVWQLSFSFSGTPNSYSISCFWFCLKWFCTKFLVSTIHCQRNHHERFVTEKQKIIQGKSSKTILPQNLTTLSLFGRIHASIYSCCRIDKNWNILWNWRLGSFGH